MVQRRAGELKLFEGGEARRLSADPFFTMSLLSLQDHQNHSMTEILDEAHAFVDSSNLQRSKDLEMCLKRVVFKMQLLSRVYKVRSTSSRSHPATTCSPYRIHRSDLALVVFFPPSPSSQPTSFSPAWARSSTPSLLECFTRSSLFKTSPPRRVIV